HLESVPAVRQPDCLLLRRGLETHLSMNVTTLSSVIHPVKGLTFKSLCARGISGMLAVLVGLTSGAPHVMAATGAAAPFAVQASAGPQAGARVDAFVTRVVGGKRVTLPAAVVPALQPSADHRAVPRRRRVPHRERAAALALRAQRPAGPAVRRHPRARRRAGDA